MPIHKPKIIPSLSKTSSNHPSSQASLPPAQAIKSQSPTLKSLNPSFSLTQKIQDKSMNHHQTIFSFFN